MRAIPSKFPHIDKTTGLTFVAGVTLGICIAFLIHSRSYQHQNVKFHAGDVHNVNDSISQKLQENVRVLCWVMTYPNNHKKAAFIKDTWGRRCNKLLFMSSTEDPDLPSVKLPVFEGKGFIWNKVKAALKHIYMMYSEYDWFVKVDDDTYVIVENLRYMLSSYNASQPIYFGHKIRNYVQQGYMSGGAGYVLSREALRRFVVNALADADCSDFAGGYEDVAMGLCLENVGVRPGDSKDRYGRERFLPIGPSVNCCSDKAITFHQIDPTAMNFLEYIVYHLRPYGIMPIWR